MYGSEGMPLTRNLIQNNETKAGEVIGNKHLIYCIVTPNDNDMVTLPKLPCNEGATQVFVKD
jgi:hypothetical protein